MKKLFTTLVLSSLGLSGIAQVFPVVDLRVSGRKDNRINMVILPDGYTLAQQTRFVQNADTIRKNAFNYTPLKEYINFFNAYCIQVPSVDSGVNHPRTATDVTETDPVMVVNNYFGSTFDNGGVHRALVVGKPAAVASVLASNIPDFDIAFILSNTKMYGGTGGKYATGTMNSASVKVAVHEWGHSFAGLADEYWPGWGYESPNMSKTSDTALVRWKNWLGYKKVGVYAHGTSDSAKLWFKPHEDCMMEYLDTVLCPVCKQGFIDAVYDLITPIDSAFPAVSTPATYAGATMPFRVKLIKPLPNTLLLKWTLNGATIAFTDSFANITSAMLVPGTHKLKVFVTDTTNLSRGYWPTAGYQFSAEWTIVREVTGIINVAAAQNNSKFFYKLYPNPANKNAVLEYENFGVPMNADYRITDIQGRVIRQKTVELLSGKNALPVDLEGVSAGTYFVQLNGSAVQINAKLTVE